MNVAWLLLYVEASFSFISWVNGYDNWSQLSDSLPWDRDFMEYCQAAAKIPSVWGKFPAFSGPAWTAYITSCWWKENLSAHLSELISFRTGSPLSLPFRFLSHLQLHWWHLNSSASSSPSSCSYTTMGEACITGYLSHPPCLRYHWLLLLLPLLSRSKVLVFWTDKREKKKTTLFFFPPGLKPST